MNPAPTDRKAITISLPDGATSEARLFGERGAANALLFLPAMGTPARVYDAFGRALAARGIATLIGDLRGTGTSSVRARRGVDFSYATLLDDVEPFREALASGLSPRTIHIGGHSLGGQIAALHIATAREPPATLTVVAAGSSWFRAFPARQSPGILLGTQTGGVLARLLGWFPGDKVGFGGRQARSLITDWAALGRTGRVHAGGLDVDQRLQGADRPVLAVPVAGDKLAPESSMAHLLSKMPRAAVTQHRVAAPRFPATLDPHFRWLRTPELVADHIAAFMADGSSERFVA